MVMEYGMAFFFRIANQPVVKFICPDTGEMLVHQMLADADIQGAHQHILFLAYLFKNPLEMLFLFQARLHHFRDIRHGGIRNAAAVYVFIGVNRL